MARLSAFLLPGQSCPFCPIFPIILVFSKNKTRAGGDWMHQRGSPYDQKFKEEALALVASGVSITNAACRLRIPKSTLADWVHTQNEGDEDGIAARREIRRTQIKRCNKVVDDVVRSL